MTITMSYQTPSTLTVTGRIGRLDKDLKEFTLRDVLEGEDPTSSLVFVFSDDLRKDVYDAFATQRPVELTYRPGTFTFATPVFHAALSLKLIYSGPA